MVPTGSTWKNYIKNDTKLEFGVIGEEQEDALLAVMWLSGKKPC